MKRLVLFAVIFMAVSVSFAQTVPYTISYQGILTNADGSAIAGEDHTVLFNFYDGTNALKFSRSTTVKTSNGLFTCVIGDGVDGGSALTPAEIATNPVYIGIQVDGAAELTPRAQLSSTPYTFQAQSAYTVPASGITGTLTSGKIGTGEVKFANLETTLASPGSYGSSTQVATFTVDAKGRLTSAGNATITSGANTALSNLTATSVSVALTPATDANVALGSSTRAWGPAFLTSPISFSNTPFISIGGGTVSNGNIFLGAVANTTNSGTANIFLGSQAGKNNTSGSLNMFIGSGAGFTNTTGASNIFIGPNAGTSNLTGTGNTIIGAYAGYSNTSSNNHIIGNAAGTSNASGSQNHFEGYQSGNANVTGNNNNFTGYQSGLLSTGNNNYFSGYKAGATNTSGSNNTAIGYQADVTTATLSKAGAIGYNAKVSANSSLVLGAAYNTGDEVKVGIGVAAPATTLHIVHGNAGGPPSGEGLSLLNGAGSQSWAMWVANTSGNLNLYENNNFIGGFDDSNGNYTPLSDRRVKKNIETIGDVLPQLTKINIRTYHFKHQADFDHKNVGVIAQELKEVYPELVKYQAEQDRYTVDYMMMGPLAIKAIQEQQQQINELKKKVADMEADLKNEKDEKFQLKAQLESLADAVEEIRKKLATESIGTNSPKK